MKSPVIFLVTVAILLLCSVQDTRGERWRLSVHFLNYTAPDKSTGNNSCDGNAERHAGRGECDIYFHLCRGPSANNLTCSDSRVYNDSNSIQFGLDGPALFPPDVLDSLPATYVLDVKAIDWDQQGGDHHHFTINFPHQTVHRAALTPGSAVHLLFHKNEFSLAVNVVTQCNPPYVGPQCQCAPHGNVLCNVTSGQQYCKPGYIGHGCHHDKNATTFCTSTICQHGGTCSEGHDGAICSCLTGYTGHHCQNNIDDCRAAPCTNGGTCVDGAQGYTCECPPEFFGSRCESTLGSVLESPCHNGGTRRHPGANCHCPAGFSGPLCEQEQNECLSSPCLNGGQCVNTKDTFHCQCTFGHSGPLCQLDSLKQCEPNPCKHGGTCHSIIGMAYCQCRAGFKGELCEVNVDECASAPCFNGGTCHDQVNHYTCTCPAHFVGDRCQNSTDNNPLIG